MRVLMLRSSKRFAGVERILLWLADELRRRKLEVGIVALYRAQDRGTAHPLVQAARRRGIPAWTLHDRAPWDPTPFLQLQRILPQFRPHLVHSHDYKSDLLAWVVARGRWVATAHGYTGESRKVRAYETLDRRVLRRARQVIAPSRSGWEWLRRFGMPPERLHVIPHGLDWQAIDRLAAAPLPDAARAQAQEATVLTFVGRHSHEKGGDTLLRTLPHLLREHPRLRAWFVGDGPERRGWMALARRVGVADRVQFWGWQENPFPFMAASDVVVIPSRVESFGLTALEAQGLGIPLAVNPVGGLAEVLVPTGVRYLTPGMEGVSALAQALMDVLAHLSAFRRAAAEAREQVRRRYTVDSMASEYARVYANVWAQEAGRGI